tara:strand:- start:2978 stop:3214 length:237 start_codon:yes stop_codon:yes gene_type:complete
MNALTNMLYTSAMADKAKAQLTLDLLTNNPAGIGDHSTEDFYKNAEDALSMLADADERLETIEKYLNPLNLIKLNIDE